MCLKRKRKINPRRNPLKLLWQPCSLKDTGGQNFSYQVLLANSLERCRRTSQTVQRVLNVCMASSHTSTQPNLHPSCLAVRMLGTGWSRTTQKGQMRIWVHLHCNWQIHQMDQIQVACEVECNKSSRVHPRHHAPLQNTQLRHHRFRFPFYNHQV
jgi:hypothetical protein